MKRIAGLLICLFLSGCQEAQPGTPNSRGPDVIDYRVREACLYRTLCPEIRRRGAGDVEGAAGYASSICQQPISQKMMQRATSAGRYPATSDELTKERMAQLEFDWHAMAVAQQLKDQCSASQ